MIRSLPLSLLPGLALLVCASGAAAAPVQPDKQARRVARIVSGIQVRKDNDLNFATLYPYAAGTAVIDPNTDVMTTTGGVTYVSGLAYAAQFTAVSPVKAVVIIRIPNRPATLTRVGGTESMTVSNWTLSGAGTRTVAAQEPFSFKVGGRLNVAANQAEGVYLGTFDVEIQYP